MINSVKGECDKFRAHVTALERSLEEEENKVSALTEEIRAVKAREESLSRERDQLMATCGEFLVVLKEECYHNMSESFVYEGDSMYAVGAGISQADLDPGVIMHDRGTDTNTGKRNTGYGDLPGGGETRFVVAGDSLHGDGGGYSYNGRAGPGCVITPRDRQMLTPRDRSVLTPRGTHLYTPRGGYAYGYGGERRTASGCTDGNGDGDVLGIEEILFRGMERERDAASSMHAYTRSDSDTYARSAKNNSFANDYDVVMQGEDHPRGENRKSDQSRGIEDVRVDVGQVCVYIYMCVCVCVCMYMCRIRVGVVRMCAWMWDRCVVCVCVCMFVCMYI
jgi:hypothetical protein